MNSGNEHRRDEAVGINVLVGIGPPHHSRGYAKRFGAAYGDVFASTFLSGAVFPSLLKQDPRYFYRGTGSTKKGLVYAIGNSVMCKGDNGHWQVNYSNMAGAVSGVRLRPPITLRETKGWMSFRTA